MPLTPSGLAFGRCLARQEFEARQLGRGDDRVVHQRPGHRVAVGVVDHLFQQRLRRALGDAAVPLPFGEQRVDDGPASSTVTCRISRTLPVSVSTSTTATWLPNGKVGCALGEVHRGQAVRPGVAGHLGPGPARRPGLPGPATRPVSVSSSMSASPASSMSAATRLACSLTSMRRRCAPRSRRAAATGTRTCRRLPGSGRCRRAPRSPGPSGCPARPATSMAQAVWCPWPCAELPV